MSAFSGPEISSSGLVFYFDINNTQKSWKGAPTTNLVNPSWASWSVDGSGQGNIGTRTISNTYECTIVDSNANTRQSIYIETGISASATYTFSVQYKKISGAPTLRFQIQAYNGGTYLSTMSFATTAQLGISDIEDWQTAKITLTTPASTNRILWFMQDGDDYTTYTHSFSLKNVQCEQQSFATPFVDGTRSNTQSILDLTNRNTVTIQNLSYYSDNTFSFDGVDDFCAVSELGQLTTFTCEVWCRPTSYPNNNASVISSVYPGTNSTVNFKIGYEGATGLTGGFYDTNGWHLSPSVGTALNTWQQVAFSYDGQKLTIYSNGVNGGSTAYVGTPNSGGSGFRIGRRWDIGDYYAGSIGIAKVYNRALTNEEIAQNFQAMRGRFGI